MSKERAPATARHGSEDSRGHVSPPTSCGGQTNGPQNAHILIPRPCAPMSPHVAKGLCRRDKVEDLRKGMSPDFPRAQGQHNVTLRGRRG